MNDKAPIRILMVEDVPADAELAERALSREGIEFVSQRVDTEEDFILALKDFKPDVIISDYLMPAFDGMKALKLTLAHDSSIPFIVLTGSMNEQTAVECMKAGATDYVIKEHKKRLPFAVLEALERKKAESEKQKAVNALIKAEQKYRSIYENAAEGIFRTSKDGRFLDANPAMINMLGYESLEELQSAYTDIARKLYVDPNAREEAIRIAETKGFVKSFETQFYKKDGSRMWVSLSGTAVYDEANRPIYYEGICEDITSRKAAEERLVRTLESLRKSIGSIVQVVATVVEAKDPYTSGHQKRVSNLARAIAQQMGLPEDTVEGIRIAGTIHDIGKISVPVEILSKPGKLSDIEFSLIKTHSQTGYDILKDIEFPWPIADIVCQHHEKINGSGYPNGLTNGGILLEAKILTVADVVEAISTHRPYRPSLGINVALDEIEKNRGILYDEKVVDACLKLFREKGFKFV